MRRSGATTPTWPSSPSPGPSASILSRWTPAARWRTDTACWCAPRPAPGKTVVGEFAVHQALATGGKCFYTTPIKALSNQKFADLIAQYGPDRVGLLTGDTSVNSHAPVVVMTTEVLRNMLYAGSSDLTGPDPCGDGRDPLPGGQIPRGGVGGGHPAPARRTSRWSACRPRCRTPRSSGLAGRGPRRADRGGGRDPAGPTVAAHAGRSPAVRPVRRRRPGRG